MMELSVVATGIVLPDALVVLIKSVLALYIVVNPASVSSVYLGLTRGMDRSRRLRIAIIATVTGCLALCLFALLGSYLFSLFRVTAGSLQIAGGLLVFGFAFALVRGREREFFGDAASTPEHVSRNTVAYYPLAVPLIAGPATITVVTTLSAEATNPLERITLFATIGVVSLFCLLSMLRITRLHERLGPGVSLIAPRIMGLVLAVIAVQFIVDGIGAVLPRLAAAWASGAAS